MKDEMTTNKLEYYVPESVRMLRILHLMFGEANSPDRMSIRAQGLGLLILILDGNEHFRGKVNSTTATEGQQEAQNLSR